MAEKFKCSFCGQEYDDPVSRAQCEIKCNEKRKVEEEKNRQEKLKADKEARKESVKLAYQNFAELRDQYIKDYREPVAFEISGTKGGQKVSVLLDALDNFSLLDRLFW